MEALMDKMYQEIEQHGRNLLAAYPNATERDPVKLCKKLRRIETRAHAMTTRMCNESVDENLVDVCLDDCLKKTKKLLGTSSPDIFINRDPRGYALKTNMYNCPFHTDWGGYGILAPDFRAVR